MAKIAINMMENIKEIRKTVMEYLIGKVVISIREITEMTREMDMAKCTGLMGPSIRAIGKEAFSMELERCSFLMVVLRKVTLKIMYSRLQLMKKRLLIV
jgi:hypothetical protein